MSQGEIIRSTDDYFVNYHARDTTKLVIVFVSAGRIAPGEALEEFHKTIEKSAKCSVIFVFDRKSVWFNLAETEVMLREIQLVAAKYSCVAAIGESMGGSGALMAAKYIKHINRVLAFSPQYSIAPPFINFDGRYEAIGRSIANHRNWAFSHALAKDQCCLLFGTRDWKDYLHSSMFASHGFAIGYVANATHNVAAFLKALDGNALVRLMTSFLDWNVPMRDVASSCIGPYLATTGISPGYFPEDEILERFADKSSEMRDLLVKKYLATSGNVLSRNLTPGSGCSQSSVMLWSRERDVEADAAGAIDGIITGLFSFHTDADIDGPWWQIDLQHNYELQAVAVFNCLLDGLRDRSRRLIIDTSVDACKWNRLYSHEGRAAFGGADGNPLFVVTDNDLIARFIRVSLDHQEFLNLDEIQVFGVVPDRM